MSYKILVVGDFHSKIHELAIYNALNNQGYNVVKFSWVDYFKGYLPSQRDSTKKNIFLEIYYRLQNKFLIGPTIYEINKGLISYILAEKPDLVFVYRGTLLLPSTLKKINKMGITVFAYNNDDPFSDNYPKYFWRHYLKGLKYYSHIFAYREKNIKEYNRMNFYNVSLLRSYFIKERNFYIDDKLPTNKYVAPVSFIGHWENDCRDELFREVIESGIKLQIYGPEWHRSKYYKYFLSNMDEIINLKDDAYNIAINSTKIALVFLSKLNNDTYTRRCFEIPATKTLMLCEYTDDMNSMFEEGKEAEYFRNKEELVQKVRYYLSHDEEREKIAEAGYQRLLKDGHEVNDRVKEIARVYENLN